MLKDAILIGLFFFCFCFSETNYIRAILDGWSHSNLYKTLMIVEVSSFFLCLQRFVNIGRPAPYAKSKTLQCVVLKNTRRVRSMRSILCIHDHHFIKNKDFTDTCNIERQL